MSSGPISHAGINTFFIFCSLFFVLYSLPGCPPPPPPRAPPKAATKPAPPPKEVLEEGAIRHTKDNSVMVLVPAGPFPRGSGVGDARPQRQVYLDAFYMDRHEVSCAKYRECVVAGKCSMPGRDHKECTYGHTGLDGYPVNCVSWSQADAYCRWAGKRLPTEAEWEKAARGTDGRVFPWGNGPAICTLTQYLKCDGRPYPVAAFSEVASPHGATQMAGNVWEWVADWYGASYYASCPSKNPQGPPSGKYRVLRGGSYRSTDFFLSTTHRNKAAGGLQQRDHGFRCAKDGPAR